MLPVYSTISAPLWLITALHILTLTLHFAAMNFVLGGLIIVLWGRIGSQPESDPSRRLIKSFPTVMAATVSLGVAPLLFLQLVYSPQIYSASIIQGWFWLLIVAAAIAAYYLFYGASFSLEHGKSARTPILFLALSALGYISFTYSSVFSLAEYPARSLRLYGIDQSGTTLNPYLSVILFRWLHMVLGALAVGGFFFAFFGRTAEGTSGSSKSFYLWGMAAAGLSGMIYFFTLGDILTQLVNSPAIWALGAGIVLSAASLYFFFRKQYMTAGATLFLSLLLMVIVRHTVRLLRLDPGYNPALLPVQPQWGVFTIFLICFVAALALIYWMVRMYIAAERLSGTRQ